MDFRKLFQVLVMGGAMVGGATSCNEKSPPTRTAEKTPEPGSASGAQQEPAPEDAGTEGGGVPGW